MTPVHPIHLRGHRSQDLIRPAPLIPNSAPPEISSAPAMLPPTSDPHLSPLTQQDSLRRHLYHQSLDEGTRRRFSQVTGKKIDPMIREYVTRVLDHFPVWAARVEDLKNRLGKQFGSLRFMTEAQRRETLDFCRFESTARCCVNEQGRLSIDVFCKYGRHHTVEVSVDRDGSLRTSGVWEVWAGTNNSLESLMKSLSLRAETLSGFGKGHLNAFWGRFRRFEDVYQLSWLNCVENAGTKNPNLVERDPLVATHTMLTSYLTNGAIGENAQAAFSQFFGKKKWITLSDYLPLLDWTKTATQSMNNKELNRPFSNLPEPYQRAWINSMQIHCGETFEKVSRTRIINELDVLAVAWTGRKSREIPKDLITSFFPNSKTAELGEFLRCTQWLTQAVSVIKQDRAKAIEWISRREIMEDLVGQRPLYYRMGLAEEPGSIAICWVGEDGQVNEFVTRFQDLPLKWKQAPEEIHPYLGPTVSLLFPPA